jgi:hypothetical protein
MGRFAGVKFFFSQDTYNEEKQDMAELRHAKASLGDDYDPLEAENAGDDPVREAQGAITLRIQTQFDRRVLRRMIDSTDWEGKKLVELPPLHKHTVLLLLQPFEKEIHAKLTEKMREE